MVETPVAMLHAAAIAGPPSGSPAVIGTNDLVKELYAEHVPGRAPILPSLHTALLAARAAGIAILDGVYNDVQDPRASSPSATRAARWASTARP